MTPLQFLRFWIFSTLLFLVGVIAFCLVMDPFHLFHRSQSKPIRNFHYSRFAKVLQLAKAKPAGLLLGTSRVDNGFNPQDLPDHTVCNAAVSGATIYEYSHFLKYAIQHNKENFRFTVIGLDFALFHAKGKCDIRLRQTAEFLRNPITSLELYRKALFSLPAFLCSLNQLKRKKSSKDPIHKVFRGSDGIYLSRYQANLFTTLRDPKNLNTPELNSFRSLIQMCAENNIRCDLIINPIHARLMEMIQCSGSWEYYENWKRMLVAIVEEEKIKTPEAHIALWDFSGYNSITTEQVSQFNDPMTYFSDSSHYTHETGKLILNTLFSSTPSFGVKLSKQTIEEHLISIKNDQQAYRRIHQKDYEEIANLCSLW